MPCFLQSHCQIEVRIGVGGIEGHGVAVAGQRALVPPQVVQDVSKVEVRLEAIRLEADRPLVERLRLDQVIMRVVDVREIDDGGHEIGIDDQRLPIG